MGKIGALTAYLFISKWFGVASFFFVIILFNTGMKQFFHIQILPVLKTLEYCFWGILWVPVLMSMVVPGDDLFSGVYGFQLNISLTEFLGTSGLAMLLGFTGLSFLILAFNIPFRWFRKNKGTVIPVDGNISLPAEPLPNTVPASDFLEMEVIRGNFMKDEETNTTEIDLELQVTEAPKPELVSELEIQIETPVETSIESK